MIRSNLLLSSDTYICTSWPPDNYSMVCKCNTLWWCFAQACVPIQIYLQDALQKSAVGFMQWNVRYKFIVECFEYLPFRVWENDAETKTLHHSTIWHKIIYLEEFLYRNGLDDPGGPRLDQILAACPAGGLLSLAQAHKHVSNNLLKPSSAMLPICIVTHAWKACCYHYILRHVCIILLWIEVICRAKSEVCTLSRLSGTLEKVCCLTLCGRDELWI